MSELRIWFFGAFRIQYGNEAVPGLHRRRVQSMLAYLLLRRGEEISREQLAFLFWPDSTEKQARTNIRNLLHQLRRSLPASDRYLSVTRSTVQWNEDSPYWLDVAAFDTALEEVSEYPYARQNTMREAEALYRGDLLPHLYDDWVLAVREDYHQRFMVALASLVDDLEIEREITPAIAFAQRLLKLDPLREETYRVLMRLYVENDDRASALQTFHVCETTLNRELGVGSSYATVQAYRSLLKAESMKATSPPAASVIPLVGRRKEWQVLFKAWQRVQRGRPHLVLLNGEAGVGKSRLANELVEKVRRQGVGVADARAYKSEGAPAYAAVVDLFQSETLREAVHSLDPVWVDELSILMPEWSREEHRQVDIEATPDVSDPKRHQLVEALTRAVVSDRKPILLHIDDVHWSDSETLAWLHFMLRYDLVSPLLILVTARPEDTEQHQTLRTLIRTLRQENLFTEIVVEPLDQADTELLATNLLGQPLSNDAINSLYTETEGNPLFIVETVRMGVQTGDWDLQSKVRNLAPTSSLPPKLQAVLETRLAQLSPVASDLAGLASVFGREFSLGLLIEACTYDEETVVQGIDELWQRRIVQEVGSDAYYFTHGKLRAVAYASLSQARRQTSHSRVAETLIMQYGKNPQFASQIARHLREAGERDEAIQYDLIAGDAARDIQAYQKSIGHYLRPLSMLEDKGAYDLLARTCNKLGLVYHLAGDYKRSDEAYERSFVLRRQLRSGRQLTADWSSRPLQTAMLDPSNPDPGRDNGRDAWLIDQLFSGLVILTEDMDVTPDVAQHWQISEDGRIYTFRLRDGVIWSDGEPVGAHDFVFAWRRVLDPDGQSPYAGLLYGIKGAREIHESGVFDPAAFGVRAVDEQTLEVELVQQDRNFLYVVAHRVTHPVPAHVVERNGSSWTDPATLVGNGPFLLAGWEAGKQLCLIRNPGYHRPFQGNAERVNVSLLENWSGQVALFEQNELDVVAAHSLPSGETLRLTRNQQLHESWAPDLRVSYVAFDTRQPPFDDPLVRQAFALATDQMWLARSLLDQYNLPATGGFLPSGLAGHTPDLALDYDPERAQELLIEAGYPGGKNMPLLQCVEARQAGIWRVASELLREQWRRNLGVSVNSKAISRRAIIDQQYGDNFPHISLLGWRADYPDPDNFLHLAPIKSQTGWCNPDYDRYVQEARTCLNRERRLELYQTADRLLVHEAPIIPLTYHRWQVLLKPWVQSYPVSTMGFWDWKDVVLTE